MRKFITCLLTAGFISLAHASDLKVLEKMGAKILSQKSLGDIIEIVVKLPNGEKKVGYVTKDNKYLIIGQVIDLNTGKNITRKKQEELDKVDFTKLPLNDALHIKFGKGGKKLVMISDPDCPFCKRAFNWLKNQNVDLYIYLFPLNIHPGAKEKSIKILCSNNSVKAMIDAEEGKPVKAKQCKRGENKLKEHILIATKIGVRGTPLFITEGGKKINGANIPRLEEYLKGER